MKLSKRLLTLLIGISLVFGTLPVFVSAEDSVKILFEDITATDASALKGEAKIKVSVSGVAGNVSIAQLSLEFDGDLKYKSIQFLVGENNPPECFLLSPNSAQANYKKELQPSIISTTGIAFSETTDLFILTFAGEAGDKVKLSLNSLEDTYFLKGNDFDADENYISPSEAPDKIEATAAKEAKESITAKVTVSMDAIKSFTGGAGESGYASSDVELKISSETNKGYVICTELNNILIAQGGHRGNPVDYNGVPTFIVENEVLKGDTYTVEVTGFGFIPYKKTGVKFEEPTEEGLKITNNEFIPGDVNGDGKINADDKALLEEAKTGEYNIAADFNRNGEIDKNDEKILSDIEDIQTEKKAPSKPDKPSVNGGDEQITVTWKKPSDNGAEITGYIIKYGKKSDNLNKTVNIDNGNTLKTTIKDLDEETTYYVSVAAVNEVGTSEYSDIADAETDEASGNGNGGGGGGGGGGGSVGGTTAPVTPQTPVTPSNPDEPFTDLGNHSWAKESIYSLKNKGIISGTSETTFSPANNIRRGDFILILSRMLKLENDFTENFRDVPQGSYYYDAIGKAKAAGIAQGSGEDFMPENSITRQDLITLCYRAFLAAGYIVEAADDSSLNEFNDKGSVAEYALKPMASMVSAGIIKGDNGNVNPKGYATRAEVAVMCERLMNLM